MARFAVAQQFNYRVLRIKKNLTFVLLQMKVIHIWNFLLQGLPRGTRYPVSGTVSFDLSGPPTLV